MSRYDLDRDEVAVLLADLPRYRAAQVWEGLYAHLADPAELGVLPRALRQRLAVLPAFAAALGVERELSADGGATVKWLLSLADGASVEAVLMHHPRHSTVCVSSQAGCAMACSFCATGDAGFTRHLSTGEIVEQVVLAARAARSAGRRLDHVVFMGMGEPLANFDNVWRAVERIVDDLGLAARHVTVSTVGVIPGIRRLAGSPRQVNLAVSLHAANDDLRDKLIPLNRRYPLGPLMAACADYVAATHRRISFEWALIDGVNDSDGDADELATLARESGAHVNLIPLNPTPGGTARGLAGSPRARVLAFRARLDGRGVNATVRRTRGRAIDAACGQLAAVRHVRPAAPATSDEGALEG
ncbi:MAG: 23S rRNA (adenine(2503)-C(2))-methyltransferase RlmN [Acidimicrobiales bacterium]|jgi:23S rRNA (adenine2503-C2)-methyltransferase